MLLTLVRFVAIAVVTLLAVLAILGMAGVFAASQIWSSASKIIEIAGIILVTSVIVLFIAKSK